MAADAKVRLLICAACKSIEELPFYEGPQEHDDTGNYKISFHRFGSGAYHPYTVGDVVEKEWKDPQIRAAILRKITEQVAGIGETGLGAEFYDVKSNFQQDAMACWKRHGKRTNCEDYKTDRMRLLPDTRAERKAEGIDPRTRPNTFLCQFCPVNSVVVTRQREARGDYDKKSWEGN